jgi:probable non-F420 flavinoid oxidoreductase
MKIGFHASHESYQPSRLLQLARNANDAGIHEGMCSDHFHPWSQRDSASGFAWSWLASALEATSMSFGTVCSPGQRYHPAIIAQAVATLCDLYPGRFWLAVGSGENLNESITGHGWPRKVDRNHRLKRSVEIMRALWRGECVSHVGAVSVHDAQLYTLPSPPPVIFGAALSCETAAWLGDWTDGLITAGQDIETLRRITEDYRENGGVGKPVRLQVAVAHAPTKTGALQAAHRRWRHAGLSPDQLADLPTPKEFDLATGSIQPADLEARILCIQTRSQLEDWLGLVEATGVETTYIHDVSDDPEAVLRLLRT